MPRPGGDGPASADPARAPFTTELDLDPSAWIAPGAIVVGRVRLGPDASIWYGSVLRGDLEPIAIGRATNVQDLTVIHVDRGFPVTLGERVTVGHRAILHGCTVGDGALVGMGAILLSGCRIGAGALVAAGAVVREGFEVPPGAIAAGVPATVRGGVDEATRRRIEDGVDTYVQSAAGYRDGILGLGPHAGRRGTER
jgi:carbonic anhydrase/acetyltransferase-like protein (isoleucine patch superfamily)